MTNKHPERFGHGIPQPAKFQEIIDKAGKYGVPVGIEQEKISLRLALLEIDVMGLREGYIEFVGEVPVVRTARYQLQGDELLLATRAFIATDWKSTDAARQAVLSMYTRDSLAGRVIDSIFVAPQNSANQEALEMLRENFDAGTKTADLGSINSAIELLAKIQIGLQAFAHTYGRYLLYEESVDDNKAKFLGVLNKQILLVKDYLAGLTLDDLRDYFLFEDFKFEMGSGTQYVGVKRKSHPAHELARVTGDAASCGADFLRLPISLEDIKTWDRLRRGWGEKEVRETTSVISALENQEVIDNAIASLELNLLDGTVSSLSATDFNPEDLKKVIANRWFRHPNPVSVAKEIEGLDQRIEFEGFSVPKKYLPSCAIELLTKIAKGTETEEFKTFLSSAGEQAKVDAVAEWVLTLFVLRSQNPELLESTKSEIARLASLPGEIRDVLLDRKYGRVVLDRRGRLKIINKSQASEDFPIYTSSAEENKSTSEKTEKGPQEIAAYEAYLLPLYSEVGILPPDAAKEFIEALFKNDKDLLGEEKLFNEFGKSSERYKSRFANRMLLFHQSFLPEDSRLKDLSRLGIEAVVIRGREVVFIFSDKSATAKLGGRILRLGIAGQLDAQGQLVVDGLEIGSAEQLFLNVHALSLSAEKLRGYSGLLDAKNDRELFPVVNQMAAAWNRSAARGSLPKVGLQTDRHYIAARPQGLKEDILIGELK